MNVHIVNQVTGRLTVYTPAELRRDALHAVKGLGKLVDYWVDVRDHGPVSLVATYERKPDATGAKWRSNVSIAI